MGRATTISCCMFGGDHVVNGAAKRESNTDCHVKVPAEGHLLTRSAKVYTQVARRDPRLKGQ